MKPTFGIPLALALTLLAPVSLAGEAQTTVVRMHKAAVADDLNGLDQHVDYLTIAKSSLSRHWDAFNEQERSKFVANFRTIVRSTYKKGLGGKSKQPLHVTGESSSPQGQLVHTTVDVKGSDKPLPIDYLMSCPAKACQLVDVVTDGSSLVSSWKRMFRRIFKKHGKEGILSRIEKKARSIDH